MSTTELLNKSKSMVSFHGDLFNRSHVIDQCFKALGSAFGGHEDLLEQLNFYFHHPPHHACLKASELGVLFSRLPDDKKDGKAFEIVRKKLNLDAKKLLQLKDETQVSDEGIKVWIQNLPELTCNFNEMLRWREELKKKYQASLLPKDTPDGRAVDFSRLVEMLKVAYPSMENTEELLGINMDATVMGGMDLTSGSLRFLNDEFKKENPEVNSRTHEWFFALYEGKDEKLSLEQNIFRNDTPGIL